MSTAQFVALGAALLAMIACAATVFAWWRTSALASQVRGTISLQGELIEIRDYVAKIDAWAKRINAREIMAERRDPTTGQATSVRNASDAGDLKNELRRRAGLLPGRPAPHREQ